MPSSNIDNIQGAAIFLIFHPLRIVCTTEFKHLRKGNAMKKAFLFARTNAVVEPERGDRSRTALAVETALDRTVIVTTPVMVGAGAIVGDRVVTSRFLVANFREVAIRFRRGKKMAAFVARRDTCDNLAELLPSSRILSTGRHESLCSSPEPCIGEVRELGEILLTPNVSIGVPLIHVAGTLYVTILGERFEDRWKINPNAPRGVIGGAVWNINGELVGLAIGEKVPPKNDPTERGFRSVYALPAHAVMDFVES